MWHEVLLSDYNFEEDTMHCQTSLQSLSRSLDNGTINAFEFGEFKKRWDALGDFKMNIPLEKAYMEKIGEHFKALRKSSGTDWYKRWSPILIVSPRA